MKFPTKPDYQEAIRNNKNPGGAKKMGRKNDGFRSDWNDVKNDVMLKALRVKFSHEHNPELSEYLLSTGDAQLVEHTPRDKYWGDGGDGGTGARGLNTLGKLLMKVRDELVKK